MQNIRNVEASGGEVKLFGQNPVKADLADSMRFEPLFVQLFSCFDFESIAERQFRTLISNHVSVM